MSQKMFIPDLGTIIVLAEDWTFRLYFENRNSGLIEAYGGKKGYWWTWNSIDQGFEAGIPSCVKYEAAMSEDQLKDAYSSYRATNSEDQPYIEATLPKGTQLKVDRVYIRNGAQSFASVSFRTTKVCPDKKFASKRFWAKLRDVNKIVYDLIG